MNDTDYTNYTTDYNDITPAYQQGSASYSTEHYAQYETAPPEPMPTPKPRLASRRRLRRDIVETLLLALVIYTFVNLTTARAIIEGPSMQPNFYTGQWMVINRAAYYFKSPERGDVVVLHSPKYMCVDHYETTGCEDLIKRVIGLPGETVEMVDGRVYVNGTLIEEPYVRDSCACNGNWTMGENEYFVLGDNRDDSYDSEDFGPIQRSLIVGEAWIRYWPPQDVNVITHPVYSPAATHNLNGER